MDDLLNSPAFKEKVLEIIAEHLTVDCEINDGRMVISLHLEKDNKRSYVCETVAYL